MAFYGASCLAGLIGTLTSTSNYVIADVKAGKNTTTALTEMNWHGGPNYNISGCGLYRSSAEVSQIGTTAFQPFDYNDPKSWTTLGNAWSAVPSLSSAALRRARVVSSNGVIWTWPKGIRIPSTASAVLATLSVVENPCFVVTAEINE